MTVEQQILLNEKRRALDHVLAKAINRVAEALLEYLQTGATLKIHEKLYTWALNYSRTCAISDALRASVITNLLDDAEYIDPETNPSECVDMLYLNIYGDYLASSIQQPTTGKFPSWVERQAGYVKGDEDLIEV